MTNKNRVQFKYSLWNEQDKKLETILYSLAGLVGILDGTLGIIVAFNKNFPYQHPIIFRTGLGSLFLVLIFGFIISCIREYRRDAKKIKKKDMIRIVKIIFFSFIFMAIMFALIIYNLMS